jgi:AcrR family transcriptional regulator
MPRPHQIVSTIKNPKRVQDRRKQLVAAAVRVFLRKGFHEATVREIGAAAGLTQGTIYNYVRSKDDILYLVCEEVITKYQTAVHHAVLNASGSSERSKAVIRAITEAMYAHQEHILLMYQEGHTLGRRSLKAILARVKGFNDFVADVLADTLDETSLVVGNRTLAINLVTFVPAILALRRWDMKGKVSLEELLSGVTEFIMRGLGIRSEASATVDKVDRRRSVKRHIEN